MNVCYDKKIAVLYFCIDDDDDDDEPLLVKYGPTGRPVVRGSYHEQTHLIIMTNHCHVVNREEDRLACARCNEC